MITEGHLCIFRTISLITPIVLNGVDSSYNTPIDVLVRGSPITSHTALGMIVVAAPELTK